MVDKLLSPSQIEDLCHEAFDKLSHTWGDGTLTWDDLSPHEQTFVETITVKVVHRLQRENILPLSEHEHSFDIQTEAIETDVRSIVTLRSCIHCGLTHSLHYHTGTNSFTWRKIEEEEA